MPDHVSKPPLQPELNVLCIDGTKTSDSAMFAYQLAVAGKSIKPPEDRVGIQNLLSLVGSAPDGKIPTPRGYTPPLSGSLRAAFPFGPADMKKLPIRKEPLPKSTQRIAEVLLPQGEVTRTTTDFSDAILGDTPEGRVITAYRNSDLLKRLCLGPGVSKVGTPSAHLDFATGSNVSTDILYLSGHGSMAATVCGEGGDPRATSDPGYVRYFELLLLLREEFQTLGAKLVSPMWMVVGACYSMRPAHAEIWLRVFKNRAVPLRGFLGYQTTSPLADTSAEINRRFANELAKGATFIQAWQKANGNNDKWTAMAFDHAKDDTLTTLRDLKRGKATTEVLAPSKDKRILRFYDESRTIPVDFTPPTALVAFHQWVGTWDEMLITNIDFDKKSFEAAAAHTNGTLVSNKTWDGSNPTRKSLVEMSEWNQQFCPERIYRIQIFPPFRQEFVDGFKEDDAVELSLVHVRQNYTHLTANFLSVFDILQINGTTADGSMYDIPPPDSSLKGLQAGTVRNRVVFRRPPDRMAFEPASIVVRFRKDAATKHYLWFWFSIKIERNRTAIFPPTDFDNFIVTIGSEHACGLYTDFGLPPQDIWGRPP